MRWILPQRAMKEIADYVAPAVEEDGLAIAIEEVVLPALLERAD